MKDKITPEIGKEIIKKYLDKVRCKEIAKIYGLNKATIYNFLNRNNIPKHNPNLIRRYTPEIIEIIRQFYPSGGSKICAEKTGLKRRVIIEIAQRNEIKKINIPTFNLEPFFNIELPEVAYVLGLIWADGYVSVEANIVTVRMIASDINEIKEIFHKTGKWNEKQYLPLGNRKPVIILSVYNKKFAEFLCENDYRVKSGASACKILSKIPENLKHYFFRGLIDGDGSFCTVKSKKGKELRGCLTISSNIKQDWNYVENLCKNLFIKYGINRRAHINKKSGNLNSCSTFAIQNKLGVIIFGNYIYQNYENDKIGLTRKYLKFERIREVTNIAKIFTR